MLQIEMGAGPLSGKDISLKIQRIGQEHCDAKKLHEQRRWDTYSSLHFVCYGRGVLIANGEKIALSKGDVFLLYKNEEYEYYPDPIDPWSYIWVDFSSNDTVGLFEPCGFSPQKPFVHLSDFSKSLALLEAAYESFDASEVQETVCSAYFMLLLSELIKNAAHNKFAGSSVRQRHIREIITYINNNFRLPLTIQKIAAENHLSVSRMMGLFSEIVGMSPIAYLNRFRISTACVLLRSSNMPIGEVANAVGVEDQLYFSRMFRKWKGISPRKYRAGKPEDPFDWLKEKNIDFR